MSSFRVFRQGGIHPARRSSYLRGVNSGAGDWSFSNHSYPTTTGAALFAAHNLQLIRQTTKWEYLQPTLGGPLDSTELGKLTTGLDNLAAEGLRVFVEPHNYGDYKTADGVTHQLNDPDGVVTNALYQDFWKKLATALKGHPAIYGYELMNEPRMMFGPYTATGADLINANGFETGIPGNLAVTNGSAVRTIAASRSGGSYSLQITSAAGGTVKVSFTGIPVSYLQNYDFHAFFKKGNGSSRSIHVGLLCYGSTGALLNANEQITGGFLTDGYPFWTPIQGQGKPIFNTTTVDLQFTITSTVAGETHYLDDLTFVPTSGVVSAARGWEISAQAAVDAIRSVDSSVMLYLPTYEWQSVSRVNVNHPNGPWIVDSGPHKYSGHIYCDYTGGGVYTNSYATDNASAVNAGFANLSAYVQSRLATFTTWLTNGGAQGALTEIGWPFGTWNGNNDQAAWQAIGSALYTNADAAQLDITYWMAAPYSTVPPGSATVAYNTYPGATTPAYPQASVIEAHPSA